MIFSNNPPNVFNYKSLYVYLFIPCTWFTSYKIIYMNRYKLWMNV